MAWHATRPSACRRRRAPCACGLLLTVELPRGTLLWRQGLTQKEAAAEMHKRRKGQWRLCGFTSSSPVG